MITNFKIFEEIDTNGPEVGDYVYAIPDDRLPPEYDHIEPFTNNKVGKVKRIKNSEYYYTVYFISYDSQHEWYFSLRDLIFWSKDKEEVESKISAMKYNL